MFGIPDPHSILRPWKDLREFTEELFAMLRPVGQPEALRREREPTPIDDSGIQFPESSQSDLLKNSYAASFEDGGTRRYGGQDRTITPRQRPNGYDTDSRYQKPEWAKQVEAARRPRTDFSAQASRGFKSAEIGPARVLSEVSLPDMISYMPPAPIQPPPFMPTGQSYFGGGIAQMTPPGMTHFPVSSGAFYSTPASFHATSPSGFIPDSASAFYSTPASFHQSSFPGDFPTDSAGYFPPSTGAFYSGQFSASSFTPWNGYYPDSTGKFYSANFVPYAGPLAESAGYFPKDSAGAFYSANSIGDGSDPGMPFLNASKSYTNWYLPHKWPWPDFPLTVAGGGGGITPLIGKVVSGSGDTYEVQTFSSGPDGAPDVPNITVKILQINEDDQIDPDTWLFGILPIDKDDGSTGYYAQPPIWLG